jgi:hypothetical protein
VWSIGGKTSGWDADTGERAAICKVQFRDAAMRASRFRGGYNRRNDAKGAAETLIAIPGYRAAMSPESRDPPVRNCAPEV